MEEDMLWMSMDLRLDNRGDAQLVLPCIDTGSKEEDARENRNGPGFTACASARDMEADVEAEGGRP
jgi:hypothetical protein